jgi:AraC-like DNA-binding protein
MVYNIANPSGPLSRFVKHYWCLENCIPSGKAHIQRIVPSGLLELIFYLGEKPVASVREKAINESTMITGQLSGYYDLKISGSIALFSIIFQPHGLSAFLDVPIKDLFNQTVPLKFVFGNAVGELETRLFEAKTFAGRIAIAEDYLLKILRNKGLKHSFKRINNTVCTINQSKGVVGIESLASQACFSRKQFERRFAELIGTSPKQFLRIVRFQNAIDKKSKAKSITLTDLTYQCGYYDQAHMINDFQKLSGMSPKQYFSLCEPYSDYFS